MIPKQLKKILSIYLSLSLLMQSAVFSAVYAQELSEPSPTPESLTDPTLQPSATPEPTPESNSASPEPTLEPTPEPTPESTPEPSVEPSPSPELLSTLEEPLPSPTPEPLISLALDASNSAEIDTVASSSADTGTNTSIADTLALMATGDAVAIANALSSINTTAIDSQIAVIVITPTVNANGDIDLNEMWQQMQMTGQSLITESTQNYPLVFTVFNQAAVNTIVFANANTGSNTLSADAVNLSTGNALSIANVGQLINADLFNAKVLFAFINILPGFSGNIILPRPLEQTDTSTTQTQLTTDSTASTSADLASSATTGSNTADATQTLIPPEDEDFDSVTSSEIETGDATSLGSILSFINTTVINNFFYSFIVNNLTANAIEFLGLNGWVPGNSVFQMASDSTTISEDGITPHVTGSISNHAEVNTQIVSQANTGYNTVDGLKTSIFTGTAQAVATLIDFTNTTVVNGKLFAGVANIASNWFGKIIIAHPDLTIATSPVYSEAEPGGNIEFNVTMANQGYNDAKQPIATFTMPPEVSFTGSSCAFPHTVVGQSVTWQLPTMAKNTQFNCVISGVVNTAMSFEEQTAQTFSLVPKAHAASHEHSKVLNVTAAIETTDKELNGANNRASSQFTVYKIETDDNSSSNTGTGDEFSGNEVAANENTLPSLYIEANHNVNEYVYAGDTVTFFINVRNSSNQAVYNTILYQTLYDPRGNEIGTVSFDLGTIQAKRGGKLTFGITLDHDLSTGFYTTNAAAYGESGQGEPVSSNVSTTKLKVIGRNYYQAAAAEVGGTMPDETQSNILGAFTASVCELPFNPIPFLIIIAISLLWFTWARRKIEIKRITSLLFLGTSMLIFISTLYAFYMLGTNYHIIQSIDQVDKLISMIPR